MLFLIDLEYCFYYQYFMSVKRKTHNAYVIDILIFKYLLKRSFKINIVLGKLKLQ